MRFILLSFLAIVLSFPVFSQTRNAAIEADSVWMLSPDKTQTSFDRFLKENKGKVIYLDIWASWCRPCINELPSSHALKEKLNGQDVVFLYISVDEVFDRWQKAASHLGIERNSYFLVNARESKLIRQLQLVSIPRYVVIDKSGKIASKDAPRPSES